ncbi:hypothetical protein PMAYCL1PPCAC_24115 [Pristionchus mayeri]|uniref:PH domain-containing protein n=1 Tax=Pristionchus mayeri TaxID=1317129 RepID=A0AAN5D145_9BILA|nr:hypothetical protein PMAYCL1PPCAC_24115 [Pristionchus mayeri]
MVVRSPCLRFEPNLFNRIKCSNCFQPKGEHSAETLQKAKMNRKVTACGWLYVAPSNLDFSQPSHISRRWQRRYFVLYDSGEFTYSLDNNPDTIPQVSMDMSLCTRVCEADSITGHSHSILVAFDGHVCYVKADTTDEIRLWQQMLSIHVKQQLLCPRKSPRIEENPCSSDSHEEELILPSVSSTPSSSSTDAEEEEEEIREVLPPVVNDEPSLDLTLRRLRSIDSEGLPSSLSSASRRRTTESEECEKRTLRGSSSLTPPLDSPALPPSSPPSAAPKRTPYSVPFHIDTTQQHTLRKGWLMLRGKSDREWSKHWVVLAGLSLKLYKDVWAEDSTEPLISIDLSECENVYPSASAKNYGIEIKCRTKRYVLSAMTPGIRDSWIDALKHNLHNPSPSYVEGTGATSNDALSIPDSHSDMLRRKKHIAYVAPESHHSNSMMSEESGSGEDEVDGEKRGEKRINSASSISSTDRMKGALIATPSRSRRDTSPAVRSPMSKIKEKSAEGRIRYGSSSSSVASSAQKSGSKTLKRMRSKGSTEGEKTVAQLEIQVRSLRDQLSETKDRLEETIGENQRLQKKDPSLDSLRRSLAAAERDIREKQTEYEELQRRLEDEHSMETQLLTNFRARLVSMLKVQLGVLSKCLDTRALSLASSDCYDHLHELTAGIARMDSFTGEDDVESLYDLLEDVSLLYDRVGQRLRVPVQVDTAVNTDICEDFCEYDYKKNDREWEAELTALQNTHESELASLRLHYEHQLKQIKERVENGQQTSPVSSPVSSLQSYEDRLESVRREYEEEAEQMREEHRNELEEEKRATRVALEAVKRMHEDELRTLVGKAEGRDSRQMDKLREELSELTSLYASKCAENAELDDRLAEMEEENERNDQHRSSLESELMEKEKQLNDLKRTISRLESTLASHEDSTILLSSGDCPVLPIEDSELPEKSMEVKFRKQRPNRRTDIRFHSNPSIPVSLLPSLSMEESVEEFRRSIAVPVAERRKFFETIAEYTTPF